MINPDLLEILRCPETRQRVSVATPELLAKLDARRIASELQNEGKIAVSEPVSAGLLREDGQRFFLIRNGIPVMIFDESIPLEV